MGRRELRSMTVYDTHCHVFNVGILRSFSPLKAPSRGKSAVFNEIGDWGGWIWEMTNALFSSPKSNNSLVISNLNAHFPGIDCATAPMMMDLSYAWADDLQKNQPGPSGPFLRNGLNGQIRSLRSLSKAGKCYPFFAVDPRRPGVVEAVMEGDIVTRQPGGFYGVKLYPRLGYHPMSGKLPDLYAYCAQNNIPITTHCSTGGFPAWPSAAELFCDPENFRPALAANPNLKINFAHWGYGNAVWERSILNLMELYLDVYADLSCYSSPGDLAFFKLGLWGNALVHARTMYGSDFDVLYFTQGGMDLDAYIKAFKRNFSHDELNTMMSQVPERFLGVSG